MQKKLYLTLLQKENNGNIEQKVIVTQNFQNNFNPSYTSRTSPIYRAFDARGDLPSIVNGEGYILYLFTLDLFFVLGILTKKVKDLSLKKNIYISHGHASIIIFSSDKDKFVDIISAVKANISAYEIWSVTNFYLSNSIFKKFSKRGKPCNLTLEYDQINHEDKIFLNEIAFSLRNACEFSLDYAPILIELLRAVFSTSQSIVYQLYYLDGIWNEGLYEKGLYDLYGNECLADIKKNVERLKKVKSNLKNKIIRCHQLKDEIVQISAVMRNLSNQVHSVIPPLTSSKFESIQNSLLGICGAFMSIFSIYKHIKDTFSRLVVDKIISDKFSAISAPPVQQNPADYDKWIMEINNSNYEGVNDLMQINNTILAFHMLYFSNRLGFRETKHSISVAYQSLYLSILPNWNLCTITHEYLHAHVRAILSSIFPNLANDDQVFNELYELYNESKKNPHSPKNLLQFMQVFLLDIVHKLTYIKTKDVNKNGYSEIPKKMYKSKLLEAFRKCHHEIDEIMVHVLDFCYFYETDPNLYVKAIWSSWLTLPVILSRIPEYIMRTISAISANKTSMRNDRFMWAINKIKTQLIELKTFPHLDSQKIEIVLSTLDDEEILTNMREQFFEVWAPLVDITLRFLYSSEIRESLLNDSELIPQDDDNYSYELTPGNFEKRRIESPISFLMYNLKQTLNNNGTTELDPERMEYNSLWLYSVVSSTLLRVERRD